MRRSVKHVSSSCYGFCQLGMFSPRVQERDEKNTSKHLFTSFLIYSFLNGNHLTKSVKVFYFFPLALVFYLPFLFVNSLQVAGNVRGTSVIYVVRMQRPSVRCAPVPTAASTAKACSSSPSWTASCAAVNMTLVGLTRWNQGRSGNTHPSPDH